MPELLDLNSFLGELTRNIRPADILDIFLASAFLFAIIKWLRRDFSSRARNGLAVVAVGFIGVYALSQVFGLYLVSLFIEILFLVFLIGTVVVFQSDIRRLVDRTTSWNILRGEGRSSVMDETIDVLTEALENMAEEKTGALIALKGKEPWERQLHGGIPLGGDVSLPLLYSLFHPESPAHDGAVLIQDNKITRFGVHLPLSTSLPNGSKYGTRHAAALGLAERTDALVLVVSEERGEISIAERGLLEPISAPGDLKARLEEFWTRHAREERRRRESPGVLQNAWTAAVSIILAVTLWRLLAYSPDILYRPFDVPIVYQNLPPEYALVDPVAETARVSVYGPQRAFRDFDARSLMLVVDMSTPNEGDNTKALTANNLNLPANITLAEIEPTEVDVDVRKLERRRLPITVETTGELGPGLELVSATPEPDSLTVMVPVEGVDVPEVLRIEPVDLSQVTESTTVSRSIVIPSHVKPMPDNDTAVKVRIQVKGQSGS